MTELRVDFCSYEAAKYAVLRWHYSRCMPLGKLVRVGAWEDDTFIGAVVFARGANARIGQPYGLDQTSVCELVRVALDKHETPTTAIVSRAIKMLRELSPGLQLIVSYADTAEGHSGTLYQAGNWIYTGARTQQYLRVLGETLHPKTVRSRYGIGSLALPWLRANVDPEAHRVELLPKHCYLMPLTRAMRRRVASLSVPYPRG